MSSSQNMDSHRLLKYLDQRAHPLLSKYFNEDQQEQMLEEDLFTGVSVTMVLAALVLIGLATMIFTVLLTA